MPQIITKDELETKNLGGQIAKNAIGGEIFCLNGDLGSGKTTFTKGFAEALSIKDDILSPTFVIMRLYPIKNHGKIKNLCHIDAYRLLENSNLNDLGFDDFLSDEKIITIIEWPEKIKNFLNQYSSKIKNINFSLGKTTDERIINYKT